jgi:hypothetical protein
VNARLAMWSWRIQERAAPDRPVWLHMLICPFCRGGWMWIGHEQRDISTRFPFVAAALRPAGDGQQRREGETP